MNKAIVYLIVSLLGCLQCEGQTALADSVRSIVHKIEIITLDSACKKYKDKIDEKILAYKTNLSKVHSGTLAEEVAQILSVNSIFLTADYKYYNTKGCQAAGTIIRIINNVDSMLKLPVAGYSPDSMNILKAISYVKNKFSGYVSITVVALNDSNVKINNPLIGLNATEPSIIPPGNTNDSNPDEIFIRPGVKYLLTITYPGYETDSVRLIALKDTALASRLKKSAERIVVEPGEGKIITIIKQGYWWIPASLFVVALFALGWKFFMSKKKLTVPGDPAQSIQQEGPDHGENYRKMEESTSQLNEQSREKDALTINPASEAAAVYPATKSKGPGTKYFFSEIMMTAGPRKPMKNNAINDMDLGEDVCGFIMNGEEVLVWILDGASDYTCLRNPTCKREFFSSRLLAQSIARKLKSHFSERNMDSFDQTMLTILNDVRLDWLYTVKSLPESEQNLLKTDLKSGAAPECAATAVIARLSLNGDLVVYRTGDSKLLPYTASGDQKILINSPLAVKNNNSFDWIFFRMVLTEKDEFDLQYNHPLFEIVKLEKVQTIIGFSDGIGQATQEALKKEYPGNSEEMRNDIIFQLQGTGDDKSLYIIEIKE